MEAPARGRSEGARPIEAVSTDFVDCYKQHYGRLVRALRLSGADGGTAEEMAQEAFARALSRWGRVSRGENPPGYVYTTGFRLLRRHLHRQSRWELGEADTPTAAATDDTATSRVMIEQVLAAMPPKRRACAVMCLLIGLTPAQAADALGIADGTARKHLEQARRDLEAIRGAAG